MSANNSVLIDLLDLKIDSFQRMYKGGANEVEEIVATLQTLRKAIVTLDQVS